MNLLKLLKNKKYLIIITFIIFTLIVCYLNKQTQYEYFEKVSPEYKQNIKTFTLGLIDTAENNMDETPTEDKKEEEEEKEIDMINNIKLTIYIRNDDGSIFSRDSSIINNQITTGFSDCKYTIDRLDHIQIKVNYPNQNNNKIKPYLNNLLINDCKDNKIINYDLVSLVRSEDYSLDITNYYMYNPALYSSEDEFLKQLEDCEKNKKNYKIIKKFSFNNDLPSPSSCEKDHNETNESKITKPDCYYSPYGCCRDGYTISNDLMGSNCKPLSCANSTFGCCRDGITTSLDLYGTNCPPRTWEK